MALTSRQVSRACDTSDAVQARVGTACTPLLSVAPPQRSQEQRAELAVVLHKLQALHSLPVELCQQLAAQATLTCLPPGALVVEEDEQGDAMYVVLSGQCHVRARPVHAVPVQPQAVPTTVAAHQPCSNTDNSDSDDQAEPESSRHAVPRRSGGDHPATYWMHKYMQQLSMWQARNKLQTNVSDDELSGLPLPLVARVAGHWRARTSRQEPKQAVPASAESAVLTPMEQLLGRGAARAVNASISAVSPSPTAALTAAPGLLPAYAAATEQPDSGIAAYAAHTGAKPLASSNTVAVPKQSPSVSQSSNLQPIMQNLLGTDADTDTADTTKSSLQPEALRSEQLSGTEQQEPKGDEAAPVTGLADPNKRLLAKMGSSRAADASKQMMQEVGARANVRGLLEDMAGRVRSQHEGHGKVTRRESFKVSHMVHQRLAAAASSQGFGPHITQLMGTQSLDTFEEELDSTQMIRLSLADWGKLAAGVFTYRATGVQAQCTLAIAPVSSVQHAARHKVQQDAPVADDNDAAATTGSRLSQDTPRIAEQSIAQSRSWSHAQSNELEAAFGVLIRTVTVGESFGELALLQQHARRTASVLTASQCDGTDSRQIENGAVNLLRIAREHYNAAVRAVRLQQLGCLLDLLQGVPPFAQLPHDKLISLAIFAKPVTVLQESVIAREGDAVDTMYIIQEGEVRLTVRQEASASTSRPRSAQAQLGSTPPPSMPHLGRASSFQRSFRRSSSFVNHNQVAVLNPGDAIGDEVCGLGSAQATSSSSGLPSILQHSPHEQQQVTHLTTATASKACTLLMVSAADLAQLGPTLTADMQKHAQERRAWRSHRIAASRTAAQIGQQAFSEEPLVPPPAPLARPVSASKSEPTSGAAYHDMTVRSTAVRRRGMSSARRLATDSLRHSRNPRGQNQSIEGLMDDVTAATFRSCALQRFAAEGKEPDSRPARPQAEYAKDKAGSPKPHSDIEQHRSREGQLINGSTSLSLQHLLAGLTPNDTPRPGSHPLQSPHQSRPSSRPGSAGKPPRPTSAGARPVSGRLRPTSATLASIAEDSYSSELSRAGTTSPLFPEGLEAAS